MKSTLQSSETPRLGTKTRRKCLYYAVCAVALSVAVGAPAVAQMGGGMGGGMGQGMGSGGRGGMSGPDHIESPPAVDKPDAAAKKFYNAGVKSLKKATEFEAAAAAAPNEDKRNAALEKKNDFYGRALDQFTAALSNQGDLYDAWNNVGYIHLQLGAYAESVDDYNHTLAMKPDLLEAVEHRAEAYMAIDRLEEAQNAYMVLFNHDPKLAAQLMPSMQQWLSDHKINANGMRAADVQSFGKWLQERDGIAKQAAALPP